jgi:hypothetical protein
MEVNIAQKQTDKAWRRWQWPRNQKEIKKTQVWVETNKSEDVQTKAAWIDDEASETEPPKPVKDLPIDWRIKRHVRILSKTLVVNYNLKLSQEASGLTGFVRCLDIKSTSSGLDIVVRDIKSCTGSTSQPRPTKLQRQHLQDERTGVESVAQGLARKLPESFPATA